MSERYGERVGDATLPIGSRLHNQPSASARCGPWAHVPCVLRKVSESESGTFPMLIGLVEYCTTIWPPCWFTYWTQLSILLSFFCICRICTEGKGTGKDTRRTLSEYWVNGLTSLSLRFLLCIERVNNPHSLGLVSEFCCPCESPFNKVGFLPSWNFLTPFKHSVNYAWDFKWDKYPYIHSSQWGFYQSAQKNTFSVERQLQTGSFCWREEKVLEGYFTNDSLIPGRP